MKPLTSFEFMKAYKLIYKINQFYILREIIRTKFVPDTTISQKCQLHIMKRVNLYQRLCASCFWNSTSWYSWVAAHIKHPQKYMQQSPHALPSISYLSLIFFLFIPIPMQHKHQARKQAAVPVPGSILPLTEACKHATPIGPQSHTRQHCGHALKQLQKLLCQCSFPIYL